MERRDKFKIRSVGAILIAAITVVIIGGVLTLLYYYSSPLNNELGPVSETTTSSTSLPLAAEARFGDITIGGKKISVEIADTPDKRALGLSYRDNIDTADGMLFIFENASSPGFWMKDMKFALDMVWIGDGKVLGISENLPPGDHRPAQVYYPPAPVNYVLELTAGKVKEWGIREKMIVEIKL